MSSPEVRRVRLRLARQRPRPQQARARVAQDEGVQGVGVTNSRVGVRTERAAVDQSASDEGQSGVPTGEAIAPGNSVHWWKRFDWAKIATIVGVVLGVASIGFTAIATYYQARTSEDALTQSTENAEREGRAQASRIMVWQVYGDFGAGVIYMQNRSPDAVVNPWLYVTGAGVTGIRTKGLELMVRVLPPCTRLSFPLSSFRDQLADFKDSQADTKFTQWNVEGIRFNDSEGRRWYRDERGPVPYVASPLSKFKGVEAWVTLLIDQSTMKSEEAAGCGG